MDLQCTTTGFRAPVVLTQLESKSSKGRRLSAKKKKKKKLLKPPTACLNSTWCFFRMTPLELQREVLITH